MNLISLADLKAFLEKTDTAHDALLQLIIDKVSARIETFLNRFLEKKERTQYFGAGRRYYFLPAYPIDLTANLEVVDGTTPQVINSDFYVLETDGLIEFANQTVFNIPNQIKVTWTGGYAATADLPDDIKYAALLQSAYLFRRRKDLGLSSISLPDGSINVPSSVSLLPDVKKILYSLRKLPSEK